MITNFKIFENKENYLKEYAVFILFQYMNTNVNSNNSRVYIRLEEFIHTGKINYLITKNDKLEHKIQILNDLQYNIRTYMEDHKLNTDNLLEYEEYVNFKESGLTLTEFINVKKYNL